MEFQKEYPYKPRIIFVLGAVLFFGAIAAMFTNEALTNDRGLIINGIITLGPGGATIFYWVMVGACAVFVFGGLWAIIMGLTSDRRLTITEAGIRAPKGGYSKQYMSINFSDMFKVTVQSVNKQRFLTLHHKDGKLSIAQSMLPDKEAFEEVVRMVTQKVKIQSL